MRLKRLPPPVPLSSPSAPPRSGSTRRPSLTVVSLVAALLLAVAPPSVEGQRMGIGFAVDSFGASSLTRSSIWFGVTPGLHGSMAYSSGFGVGFAPGRARRGVPFLTWATYRYGAIGKHGGGRRYRDNYSHGYWGAGCWSALWDPFYSYWTRCPAGWSSGFWQPYPATASGWYDYPGYPVYSSAYYPAPYDGWSVGIHLSFGSHWGSRPYGWQSFDPWLYGWDDYYWYGPRTAWRTVYVDPGPRWVVRAAPRVVRTALSPRIGSGGWVSQAQFKENPRSADRVRTATARPSRPAGRPALDRQNSARSTPRSNVVARAPTARGTATPTRSSRTRRESSTAAPRPTVIRGSGSRPQTTPPQGRANNRPRATVRPTTPTSRTREARPTSSTSRSSAGRPTAPQRGTTTARPTTPTSRPTRAVGSNQTVRPTTTRPAGQVRAPDRSREAMTSRTRSAPVRRAAPARSTASRSTTPRAAPSRSPSTRSATPSRAAPSRASARPSGGAARTPQPRAQSRTSAPAPQRSRPTAAPSRNRGSPPRSAPPRASVRR